MKPTVTSFALFLSASLGSIAPNANGQAISTTRVSVDSAGVQANLFSDHPSISNDGRYVVFQSNASNLVPGDNNAYADIFVRDLQTGQTTRVSLDSAGVEGNLGSSFPSISADGRYVAFTSNATNLVTGDTNVSSDVFLHDRQTSQTTRVSVDSAGVQGNNGSYYASISADGRYVAFLSFATNLVPGGTNGHAQVFVHDLQTGQTTCESVQSGGAQGNGDSSFYSISADGRFVGFHSTATNLVPGDTNARTDAFVHDRQTGQTIRVSVDSAGVQGDNDSYYPAISADGRYVAFESNATNLVPGDTNGVADVFVRDSLTGQTTRVSIDSTGLQGNAFSGAPSISADGSYVTFQSSASNLVPGDTNGKTDVFVHERQTGQTVRLSVDSVGVQGNDISDLPSISADGRYVTFRSGATNLVPGDNNGFVDVFVRDRGVAYGSILFCFGDAWVTPCPCANTGSSGNGCANSFFAAGAHLAGSGAASVSADTFLLAGSGMPNAAVLYFQGTTQVNGGGGTAFGDGLRCAGGAVLRLGTKTNSSNGSVYPASGDPAISIRGSIPPSGGTRTYQAWYRNVTGPCGSGFNLTNGVQVTWMP